MIFWYYARTKRASEKVIQQQITCLLYIPFLKYLKRKRKMYCCFIDFEKAFDKEWRDGLWYKLLFNYMNGNMHIVILNMYKDTKSCIVYNNVNSNFFYCNNRVRQGVNMSPFLFALYLNDLESFLGTCKLKGLESISRDIEDKFDIYLKLLIHYMLMPPFWSQNIQRNYKCFWTHLMIIAQFGNWKWMLIKLKSWFFSRGRQPQKLKFSLNELEL
jgi:hypothetical protein